MRAAPLAPADPPPISPPRVGLIRSGRTPDDPAGFRWEAGFSYDPDCLKVTAPADVCDFPPQEAERGQGLRNWQPYILWESYSCTAAGLNEQDMVARVRRKLAATESAQLARELWRGETARAAGYPNLYLASPEATVVSDAALSPSRALACLEQYVAECGVGKRSMIHATPLIATYWAEAGLIRRDGPLLLTALDTIVVPDAGYDGSGPGTESDPTPVDPTTSSWAYASDLVDIRLGAIQVVGGRQAQGFGFQTNDVQIFARRPGVASWTGCCHGAAEIEVAPCGAGS